MQATALCGVRGRTVLIHHWCPAEEPANVCGANPGGLPAGGDDASESSLQIKLLCHTWAQWTLVGYVVVRWYWRRKVLMLASYWVQILIFKVLEVNTLVEHIILWNLFLKFTCVHIPILFIKSHFTCDNFSKFQIISYLVLFFWSSLTYSQF